MTTRTKLLLLTSILLLGVSGVLGQDTEAERSRHLEDVEGAVEAAPVVVDGIVLFRVRGITTFPAPRRAERIADRIRDLARDRSFDPATLAVVGGDRDAQIVSGERRVLVITEADAEFEGLDRRALAEVCVSRIQEAIVAYRAARTREALVSSAWKAGLAIVLGLLGFVLLRRIFRTLNRWVEREYMGRVKAVTIRSFEVMRAERIWGIVQGAIRTVGALSRVAVVVLLLRYTLGLFPWTRGAALQIDDWVFGPLAVLWRGFVEKIPNLIFLVVLFFLTRYLLRLIHLFFAAVGRGEVELEEFEPTWAEPTYKIVRLAVVAFAVIVAYPYIPGSSSEAFKGVSLFAGILLSLGSSSTISNLVAGYVMIYRQAFHEGDVVKIGGVVGFVSRVRLQVTHLTTPKNEDVVIPNSTILNGEVINYSALARSRGLILHTTVGIGYETPWRQVEAMLIEAAGRTEGLLREPSPFVHQTALGDFAVTYEINAYCNEPRRMAFLYTDLHRNILDLFNEHGVQIMTPAYEGDPQEPKVVPRDKWQWPPAGRQ